MIGSINVNLMVHRVNFKLIWLVMDSQTRRNFHKALRLILLTLVSLLLVIVEDVLMEVEEEGLMAEVVADQAGTITNLNANFVVNLDMWLYSATIDLTNLSLVLLS